MMKIITKNKEDGNMKTGGRGRGYRMETRYTSRSAHASQPSLRHVKHPVSLIWPSLFFRHHQLIYLFFFMFLPFFLSLSSYFFVIIIFCYNVFLVSIFSCFHIFLFLLFFSCFHINLVTVFSCYDFSSWYFSRYIFLAIIFSLWSYFFLWSYYSCHHIFHHIFRYHILTVFRLCYYVFSPFPLSLCVLVSRNIIGLYWSPQPDTRGHKGWYFKTCSLPVSTRSQKPKGSVWLIGTLRHLQLSKQLFSWDNNNISFVGWYFATFPLLNSTGSRVQ